MDARLARFALIGASLLLLGANYRTQHFIVTAATPQLAQEVGLAAERLRHDLAIEWLGHELPPWTDICPITVHVAPGKPAGGETSFVFPAGGGEPTKWRMIVEGTRERVLDSVLPHEITHTIFATHFRQPLPRWADEGACTTVEHDVEKQKQERLLIQFLTSNRGIAFNQMFAMREYPRDILPLYSQGYALARYLIAQGGKRKFVDYVGDGLKTNNWTHATRKHYGFESLSDLQVTWLDWVREGSPPIAQHPPSAERMAAHQGQGRPGTRGGDTSLVSTTTNSDNYSGASSVASDSRSKARDDSQSPSGRARDLAAVPTDPLATPSGPASPPSRDLAAVASNAVASNQQPLGRSNSRDSDDRIGNHGNANDGNVNDGGWYARQRDRAIAARQQQGGVAGSTRLDSPPPSPPRPNHSQSSARPREVEGAKQVVLEWSRGHSLPNSQVAASGIPPLAEAYRSEPSDFATDEFGPDDSETVDFQRSASPAGKAPPLAAPPVARSRSDAHPRTSDLGYTPGSTRSRY